MLEIKLSHFFLPGICKSLSSLTQSLNSADVGEEGEELDTEVQLVDKPSLFPTVFDTLGKCILILNFSGCLHTF